MHTAEAVSVREGSSGFRGSGPAHRSEQERDRPPERCLPPSRSRSDSGAQDTQREYDDISHGARFPSAYEPGRSLCRFSSPAPSALRVSHSLSGLSPPGPGGFVSRHIRPWDFGLQSFSLSTSRDTSRCPLLSCRFSQLGFCSGKPELRRRPCNQVPRNDLPFADRHPRWLLSVTPTMEPASSSLRPTEAERRLGERPRPLTRGEQRARNTARPVRDRSIEALSGRREPTTSERCSG